MNAVVQGRMRETQQPSHNSGFADGASGRGMLVMRPVSLPQPGSAQAKQILSRYRPIAPKPVSDQTTTTASAQSSLSTDNASTTKSKSRGSRKRPSEASSSKLPKSKKQTMPTTAAAAAAAEDGFHHRPEMAVEFHPGHENLTPLFPVGVAHQFGPGGWQRFHDSFGVSASAAPLNCSPSDTDTRHPTPDTDAGLSLHIGVGVTRFSTAENEMSRLFQPRGCSSTSFGTDSEVTCSSDKSDIVTLALLPDTPSNVRCAFVDRRSPATATATAAAMSSDLNTSLTMASTACRGMPHDAVAASTTPVVDVQHLEQRHGGSSEAVLLADEFDQLLWTNAAFQRLSHERLNSRLQAMAPHIDPLGIRTQLATLTFQPPCSAPKCKAVLWGFLKKFILHESMETEDVHSQSWL